MKTIAFIFARGGSKGLPGKNLMPLGDKPLIAHSITFAKCTSEISDVVVSTDSKEIASVAERWGATVPFLRPAELSNDTAPEMLAWRHAADYYRKHISPFDNFVSLPAVSPLRMAGEVGGLLNLLNSSQADFVLSGCASEVSPYSNLIERKPDLGFKLCMGGKAVRRQDTPAVFRIIPMYYACRVETIFQFENLFDGRVEMFEIPRERSVDVDTAEDFKLLEFMYKNLR